MASRHKENIIYLLGIIAKPLLTEQRGVFWPVVLFSPFIVIALPFVLFYTAYKRHKNAQNYEPDEQEKAFRVRNLSITLGIVALVVGGLSAFGGATLLAKAAIFSSLMFGISNPIGLGILGACVGIMIITALVITVSAIALCCIGRARTYNNNEMRRPLTDGVQPHTSTIRQNPDPTRARYGLNDNNTPIMPAMPAPQVSTPN